VIPRALVGFLLAVGALALVHNELAAFDIPIGPFVTQLAWLALWLTCRMGSRPCPFADAVSWYELAPAVIAIVFVQLLLDMHTPGLGDAIVAGVHAIALIVVLAIARCNRRARRS
jgi:hypothetical protein